MNIPSRPSIGRLYNPRIMNSDGDYLDTILSATLRARYPEADAMLVEIHNSLSTLAFAGILVRDVVRYHNRESPEEVSSIRRRMAASQLNAFEAFNNAVEDPNAAHFASLFHETNKYIAVLEECLQVVFEAAKPSVWDGVKDKIDGYRFRISRFELLQMEYELSGLAQMHRSESHG